MTKFSANGDYISGSVSINDPTTNVLIVREELENTRTRANEVLTKLVGEEGDGGLLGDMINALAAAPLISITPKSVDTTVTLESSGQLVPTFDESTLREFPNRSYDVPTMATLPSIDTDFSDVTEPTDLSLTMAWAEAVLPTELFTALKAKLLDNLVDGATGIDPSAEEAIYNRARTRQAADRLAEYNRINDAAADLQFAFPSGVLLAGLAGFSTGANRMDADIENQIIVNQSDLAQKNTQHITVQAVALEQLLRQTRNEESQRAYESVMKIAELHVQDFAERVKKFIGVWEGRKVKVQAQVESLRGVLESNKGLIDIFSKQYDALATEVQAVSSFNKGLTDVFTGRAQGFSAAEQAVSSRNDSKVRLLAEQIKNADREDRAKIAEAEEIIKAYGVEQSVREQITAAVANISSQVAAALLSAVHTSMGASYNASETADKSYRVSVGVSESHEVPHNPAS